MFLALLERNSLPLRICKASELAHFASDATLNQLASVLMDRSPTEYSIERYHSNSIISNEIRAALLSFSLFSRQKTHNDVKLVLHVANMAAVSFLNKGRANYATMPIRAHFSLLTQLHTISNNVHFNATYKHTTVNPADAL